MKNKISSYIILFFSIVLFQTCEEPFSPYAEFKQFNALNCIVRADTNLLVATIFKSFPPEENTAIRKGNTNFVHNSLVRIWRGNDDIFFLKDSTANITDSLNAENPVSFYYAKGLELKPNDDLEIEALLPDGNRLKSKTVVPDFVTRDTKKSTEIIPPKLGNEVIFVWKPKEENLIYISSLEIIYKQKVGDIRILKRVKVPWKYVSEDGSEVELEKPPSKIPEIRYNMANIDNVLESISEGDANKKNYFILAAILEIKILDKNLSEYYLSSNRVADTYSVRLDLQDFTNIDGGLGIFGSFLVQEFGLEFDDDYLLQFGYQGNL